MIYKNLKELLMNSCGDSMWHMGRNNYKYTDCGPWTSFLFRKHKFNKWKEEVYYEDYLAGPYIKFQKHRLRTWPRSIYKNLKLAFWKLINGKTNGKCIGIRIGSIVEGVDQCAEPHTVLFPMSDDDLSVTLTMVNNEANSIWNATHGCEDCRMEDPETGECHINPKCKTCKGEGAII